VLIIIYITTAILVLTGFQPLIIASIFFGICYLPGLAMFALIKKEILQFEELVLAFPVSIGISSVLVFGLLYVGVHVTYTFYLIIGIAGIMILMSSIKHGKLSSLTVRLSGREFRFVIFAFMTTLAFSIPVISERIVISAHGFHHSIIATQIINGIFPPENPGMGGTSLSYHWGYHTFIAAIASPSSLPPLVVISVLNVMALFFILCIAYRSGDYLEFADGYRYLVPLALIGLMRSDAVIFLANKLFFGNLISLRQLSLPEMGPTHILQDWIWGGGAPWFDRRLFFMSKFYNANTMPLGIVLCLSYFLFLLAGLKKTHEYINSISFMLILGLLITANCIIYPPLAIIPLLHAPVWASIGILSKRTDIKTGFKESLQILIPYGLAVLIVLPYFLSVSSNTGEPIIRINFYDQSIINLVAFWLPMPLIFIGAVLLFRKMPSKLFIFLIVAAALCFSLSTFTQVSLGNSSKFTFILSFFYALFFVLAVSKLMNLISKRWIKLILSAYVILFLLLTPIITEAGYIVSPWFIDNTYSFSRRHILFSRDGKRNEAYTWIRENTPPETLVMLTYFETLYEENIAHNSTYEPAALTERNLFVVKDWYTISNPEYSRRIKIREKHFVNPRDGGVQSFFASLKRPVYLLVEDRLPTAYLREERFNEYPDNPEGFLLVFKNNNQRVYFMQR
jgi:hypothetical protein